MIVKNEKHEKVEKNWKCNAFSFLNELILKLTFEEDPIETNNILINLLYLKSQTPSSKSEIVKLTTLNLEQKQQRKKKRKKKKKQY